MALRTPEKVHDRLSSDDLEKDDQDPEHLTSWRLGVVITSLCLGAVLYGLDMNIIGVAVPAITSEFHSLDDIAWYSAVYLLTITAFQPFFGNIYKYFPAKSVYVVSIIFFEIGSLVCATASSSPVLIFGRALLGCGAAGLLQGALGIVSFIVELEKVPMYQGIIAAAAAISATAGPVIGGALTDHANWRWCFWINIPIGLTVAVGVFSCCHLCNDTNKGNLQLPLREKLRHLDLISTVIFLGAIVSLLLALQWGGRTMAWNSAKSIGLFICFGTLTIIFIIAQWKLGEYATIPFRIVRIRSVYMGAMVLFFLGVASISLAFYLPLYFQAIQGVSATHSGINMLAYVAPTIVSIGITGALVSKLGHYVPFMVVGAAIGSIAAGFMTRFDADTPTLRWAAIVVVHRIGLGMAQQLPYTALQAVLETADTLTGNAIAIFFWQLGGAVAVSVGQTLLLNNLRVNIPKSISGVAPQDVIDAGAGGIAAIAQSPLALRKLREAYAESLKGTFVLALVGSCLALPFAAGMQWLNIKKVAEDRRNRAEVQKMNARNISDIEVKLRGFQRPVSSV
ncbi:MFS general substrate transporter [Paraphaeosphaeria sporulosa]|uniref:MFS general substrate transporter n=1 Tax=Paraphaeosphaeria sporulosa TaxID=1460663 RepID=A0A177CPL8_9PLEO|nr:MFS general substrate transporter [Paraphaeosphaeria sporulosa]OAG09464.1 MFS general substrate transporter [Paraphaeosphaeria sporulosa]